MMEKIKIGDSIYSVISEEEFSCDTRNFGRYDAVEHNGYVYPVKSKQDVESVGVVRCGSIIKYTTPTSEEDKQLYSSDNIINFSQASSLKEVIERTDQLRSAERSILTKADNIFQANIGPNDTPIMKGLKQAINDKNIDLDKYDQRFGPNFHNDKRILTSEDITIKKFVGFLNRLDLKATITIEDRSSDAPNPMGHTISVELNPDGDSSSDD